MRVQILAPQWCVNGHYMKLIYLNSYSTLIKHKTYAFKWHISFWNQFTLSYLIFDLLWWQKWTDLRSINLEKVIYSTGFYSPPVMKIEDYEYSQLSMESFAAENRVFVQTRRPKLTKIGHILAPIWSDRCFRGVPPAGQAGAITKTFANRNRSPLKSI